MSPTSCPVCGKPSDSAAPEEADCLEQPHDGEPACHGEAAQRDRAAQLAADLDTAAVLLAFFGALSVPMAMPQIVRRITGHTAESPELEAWSTEQIQRLIRHLSKR